MSQPIHGKADYLDLGGWNATCNRCGRKFKAGTLKLMWTGEYVCPPHWEARQPQDFVRTPPDDQIPPWTQPRPQGIEATFCTPNGLSDVAGFSVSGCWIAGYLSPAFDADIVTLPLV